jgi:protein tyrosine/serine phosphatase
VPHTSFLWRGYHPYKKSRPAFDTENIRIKMVNKVLKHNHIKSIITLCGNESLQKASKEKISRYVRKIQKKGNQLFIDTSYETVYFESDSEEYSRTVKEIVEFIISHPAPFYIHCRLGSDRTGTMSSIMAALCGADWNEIKEDYEKTSKAGFGEFRSARLLEYSYKKLLGKSPVECENLQKAVEDYFTGKNILSKNQIEELRNKLN